MACAVYGCSSTRKSEGTKFFAFPKQQERMEKWKVCCKRLDEFNVKNARICSKHFAPEAFYKPLIQVMLNYSPKKCKKLRDDALPTLLLPNERAKRNSGREERLNVRKRKIFVKELLEGEPATSRPRPTAKHAENERDRPDSNASVTITTVPFDVSSSSMSINTKRESDAEGKLNVRKRKLLFKELLEDEPAARRPTPENTSKAIDASMSINTIALEESLKENDNLVLFYKQCLAEERQKVANLEKTVDSLKVAIKTQNLFVKEITNKSKNHEAMLRSYFSPVQVLRLESGKRLKWSPEDISSAITLRCMSPRAYRYLRKEKKFPLPGLSTLRRWARKLKLNQGLLSECLMLMGAKGKDMSDSEKLCVLSYDEMSISEQVDLDKARDQILGPHNKVQVVMVRGLCSPWKQPIFYKFDAPMTEVILKNIITRLYDIGFTVVAVTSDMGPENRGLWKKLNITKDNTHIPHPADESRKIYFFADAPHLLKLVRNHYLDTGFQLPDGTHIGVEVFWEMLQIMSSGDLKIAHKLTEQMLTCKGPQRQRVSPAAKLFSRSNAEAVRFLGEKGHLKYEKWAEASKFVKLINDWFDIFNANSKFGMKKGFGLRDSQRDVLLQMLHFAENSRTPNHRSLVPFQTGIIISIKSLFNLFEDLKTQNNLQYILTSRLSQDVLENFFSFMRGMGREDDHPSALQFHNRLRLYIMAKHSANIFSENANCEPSEEENLTSVLTAEVLGGVVESTDADAKIIDNSTEDNSTDIKDLPQDPLGDAKAEVQQQGLLYLTGYTAHKFRSKYPHLAEVVPANDPTGDWISYMSNGGLLRPNKSLMEVAATAEKFFLKSHGSAINRSRNAVKNIVEEVLKIHPDEVPVEVVAHLIRVRTFIRIRQINQKMKKIRQEKKKSKSIKLLLLEFLT